MKKVNASAYWDKLKGIPEISQNETLDLYTNIWGELIVKSKDFKYTLKSNPQIKSNQLSFGGHAFGEGYYNIDEEGNEVFCFDNPDEFYRIGKKVKLIEEVNNSFKDSDLTICVGPNNSVSIDDINIVPNCYWDIPENDDDLNKYAKIIAQKVKDFTFQKNEITDEDVHKLELCVINSICNLEISYLSNLKEEIMYSYSFKDELIIEFSQLFKKFLLKGITSLKMKPSKCLYCYPESNAYSFYHPDTDEFVIRYVIGKSKKELNHYVLEECRNKPISKD